jgi:cellulose synthase operon protein C
MGWATDSMTQNRLLSAPVREARTRRTMPCSRSAWLMAGAATLCIAAASVAQAQTAAAQATAFQPAAAQPAVPPAAAVGDGTLGSAIGLLLEKAQFWDQKGRPDVAIDFYTRVLTLQPENTDALAGAAKVSLDLNHDAQAHEFLDRLRKVAPSDPFIVSFDTMRRRSPDDAATLADARHLAAVGKKKEALDKYRSLFSNKQVPDDLAGEYYPLYISTLPEESVEANDALTALQNIAAKNPKDLNLQLATDQAMVDIEGSRADGIERLRQLSHVPAVAARAKAIWRQALLWQGADFNSLDQLNEYLAENPTDPEIDAKLAEYKASLPSPGLRARMNGYEAIRTKDTATAEKDFQAAIDYDANDADAWIMMAVVRQMQGRPEWRKLMDKAISIAPDRKTEFLNMLGADPVANAKAAADAAAKVQGQYRQVDALANAGRYAEAERLLRSLIGNSRNAGSYLELAGIQTRAGQTADAEASLRTALSFDPDNADANVALAGLLNAEGKSDEAKQLLARAEASYQAAGNARGVASIRSAKADSMRIDALKIADPAQREHALRAALDVDPSSWWIRLEIARTLYASDHQADAQAMMAEAAAAARAPGALDTQSGQDALQVAFIWAQERNDQAAQVQLAELVPPAKRSASMRAMLADFAFHEQVSAIAADPATAPPRLMDLANAPDPTGQRGQEIGQAFLHLQDPDGMRAALFAAYDRTPAPTPRQRLTYAGVLMQGNLNADARAMVAPLEGVRLPPDQAASLDAIHQGMAVTEIDRLLQAHRVAEADALVRGRLAQDPNNAALQVELARVQVAQGRGDLALPTLRAALQKDPSNLGARFAAIEAAMKTDRYSLASDLSQDGMRLYPRNPYLVLQAANAARARGLNADALSLMVRARDLLARQDQAEAGTN